jgi:hypothetical protein
VINDCKGPAKLDPVYYNRLGEASLRFYTVWMNSIEISTFDPFMLDNDACQYKDLYMGRCIKQNEEVIQGVPKENLLIMKLDGQYDDWEELSTFLNLPIPSVPFPNKNKGDANVMIEASKAKLSSEGADQDIFSPPPHGNFLEKIFLGILCVLSYYVFFGILSYRSEIISSDQDNRIPFTEEGNKKN